VRPAQLAFRYPAVITIAIGDWPHFVWLQISRRAETQRFRSVAFSPTLSACAIPFTCTSPFRSSSELKVNVLNLSVRLQTIAGIIFLSILKMHDVHSMMCADSFDRCGLHICAWMRLVIVSFEYTRR
jgi:hypothetical protein